MRYTTWEMRVKTETEKIELIITPGKYQRELSGDIFGRVTFGAKYLSK